MCFIQKHKPKVLIHNSDEYYICKDIAEKLYPMFELVLKQYSSHYYTPYSHVRRIPLGFNIGVCDDITNISDVKNRPYFWSFIGTWKSKSQGKERDDRIKMIESFQKRKKNHFLSEKETAVKMKEIYQLTKFIPVGMNLLQGKVQKTIMNYPVWVDCFRTYEAIVCGAIPVNVGSESSIKETFNNCQPPIIYEESWDLLLDKLEKMTEDEIDTWRKRCRDWWYNEIYEIKKDIAKIEFSYKKKKKVRRVRVY